MTDRKTTNSVRLYVDTSQRVKIAAAREGVPMVAWLDDVIVPALEGAEREPAGTRRVPSDRGRRRHGAMDQGY